MTRFIFFPTCGGSLNKRNKYTSSCYVNNVPVCSALSLKKPFKCNEGFSDEGPHVGPAATKL